MRNMMKLASGTLAGVAGLWAPAVPLMLCALLFVAVDFMTGVLADRQLARRSGRRWHFESHKAWRSVRKLSLVMVGIVMAAAIDALLGGVANLSLAKLFTGFVCGVEFWSYLENAAHFSDSKLFRGLRRVVGDRLEQVVGDINTADHGRHEQRDEK